MGQHSVRFWREPLSVKRAYGLYNARNLERAHERQMLWNVWEDIPGPLGSDFVRFSSRRGEIVMDGEPVLPGLAHVSVPACFFAGAADWLAPVSSVRAGFDAWGVALPRINKHFLVLGAENGTRHDYGRCDICCGQYARDEVFEPAARFLATGVFRATIHSGPVPASAGIAAAAPAA